MVADFLPKNKLSLAEVLSDKTDPVTSEMYKNFTVKCEALKPKTRKRSAKRCKVKAKRKTIVKKSRGEYK